MRTLRGVDRWSIWIVHARLDLRGQQVIRYFGVRELDGDTATAVAGEDGTAAVDGAVRELSRGGVEQSSHARKAGGHAENLDHGSTV